MELSDYQHKYQTIRFERRDHVLEVTLHTRGSEALWGTSQNSLHNELGWAFADNGLRSSSTRRSTTDQHGQFVFTGLGPDLHTLEISSAGFNTATKTINVGADPVDIVIELQEWPR